MPQHYEHILVDTTPAGVRTLTLNRPERLNAVNAALMDELPQAIAAAGADEAVRALVITGAGRGFCAGLDLSPDNVKRMTSTNGASRASRLDDLAWVGQWVLAVTNCPLPVIAALNGVAAGAGLGLALAADIRLMSATATLTTGYIRRGLSPDAGISYFLPRMVGASRAADLILTARDVAAEEAERIGLVSRILAAETFTEEVTDYAARVAAGPPLSLALTKRLLLASYDADLTTQLRSELQTIKQCLLSEDFGEALRAFHDKRAPNFTGR